MDEPRIYLDNAATCWPKPEAVYSAVDRYMRESGAPLGRSTYSEAVAVGQAVEAARRALATLVGAPHARQIIFTFNGTDSLNLAIHGVLTAGDHVVTTAVEHNSVLRPLRHLEDQGLIEVTRVGCDAQGIVDPRDVESALRTSTKLVAMVHASNVTGALQPIEEVTRAAHARGALVLVDAAQTLGHLPLDVEDLQIDLLAAPGHKGLLGPLGTGILYIRQGVEERLDSFRQGGTGSRSEEDRQPESLPDKYEPGNHNAPGILGLAAGVAYLQDRGLDQLRRHSKQLTQRLIDGFSMIEAVTIYGPSSAERQVEVVSINVQGYGPQELAAALEAGYRIQVRGGLHCAPLMHEALGTLDSGGTVRFSLGPFSSEEDVDAAIGAVREIAEARLPV